MIVSSDTILLGDGTVFATLEAIDYDFYSEDLPACSETHLQLPLKLKIVGKKLWRTIPAKIHCLNFNFII